MKRRSSSFAADPMRPPAPGWRCSFEGMALRGFVHWRADCRPGAIATSPWKSADRPRARPHALCSKLPPPLVLQLPRTVEMTLTVRKRRPAHRLGLVLFTLSVSTFLWGQQTAPANPLPARLPFSSNLDEAVAMAKAERKPVVVYFAATWCPVCRRQDGSGNVQLSEHSGPGR